MAKNKEMLVQVTLEMGVRLPVEEVSDLDRDLIERCVSARIIEALKANLPEGQFGGIDLNDLTFLDQKGMRLRVIRTSDETLLGILCEQDESENEDDNGDDEDDLVGDDEDDLVLGETITVTYDDGEVTGEIAEIDEEGIWIDSRDHDELICFSTKWHYQDPGDN